MSRFDYVKYDDKAYHNQACLKAKCETLEAEINDFIESPRAKALALTKLEECYMWIGKAVRDDQLARNSDTNSQEERTNS